MDTLVHRMSETYFEQTMRHADSLRVVQELVQTRHWWITTLLQSPVVAVVLLALSMGYTASRLVKTVRE
jgi:hypothetical protein